MDPTERVCSKALKLPVTQTWADSTRLEEITKVKFKTLASRWGRRRTIPLNQREWGQLRSLGWHWTVSLGTTEQTLGRLRHPGSFRTPLLWDRKWASHQRLMHNAAIVPHSSCSTRLEYWQMCRFDPQGNIITATPSLYWAQIPSQLNKACTEQPVRRGRCCL